MNEEQFGEFVCGYWGLKGFKVEDDSSDEFTKQEQ